MTDEVKELPKTNRPLTYKIYKGMGGKQGCFQFSLLPAYSGKRKDEGAVFIEAAPTIGKNQYDWDNKVIFALSVNDIGSMLAGFTLGKMELYHDPDAKTNQQGSRPKKLSLESGQQAGTFFLRLSEKSNENTKNIAISLQPQEVYILVTLLKSAIPKVMGWE